MSATAFQRQRRLKAEQESAVQEPDLQPIAEVTEAEKEVNKPKKAVDADAGK